MTPQVLIIGAGPVGLTMAIELARHGIGIRIIDKAAAPTDKSKAIVIWPRTLELLERSGPVDGFVDAGLKMDGANIRAGERLIAHVDLTEVESRYSFALSLPQSDTERLLAERLKALDVEVEREVELLGFTDNGASVTARLKHADGHEEALETAWLVGCDGAHSATRHTLALGFEGSTIPSDFILADVHVDGMTGKPTELGIFWHRDGILASFPLGKGRFRLIADVGQSQGEKPREPTLDEFQAIVDIRGPQGLKLRDPVWLSGFRINERKVRDYRTGRVFLAGDAAHVHSPAGGQGMNTGMQDALNLGWKLALVCLGTCGEAVLDSYSAERSAVGDKVLADAGRLTSIAMMRNPVAQTVRNAVAHLAFGLDHVRHTMAANLSELTIGYAESPLNGPATHGLDPAPGQRFATAAGEPVLDTDRAPRFALFGAAKAVTDLAGEFPDLLELRTPRDNRGVWLVRPDGYVAAAVRVEEAGRIAGYLGALRQG